MPNALGDMPVPHDVAVRFSNYGIPVLELLVGTKRSVTSW
jgi:hypothetical protein